MERQDEETGGRGRVFSMDGVVSKEVSFGSKKKPVLSPFVAGLLTITLNKKRKRRDMYVNNINSKESSIRLEGTKKLALLLEADPRVGDLRPQDVRLLIGFLKHRENPQLQFYALFALTNVDQYGGELIRDEALPLLVKIMKSKHEPIQMQVLITLCRVVYDFPESVLYLRNHGALKVLLNIVMNNQYDDMMLRNCSTFLAIVCFGISIYYGPCSREMETVLRIVKFLLQYGKGYDNVQSQTLAAVSFYPTWKFGRKACPTYLGLISDADPLIVVSALHVILKILVRGRDEVRAPPIMVLLEGGLLHRLYNLSHCEYKIVRFQVCWILNVIVQLFGKQEVWCHNGVFMIVESEKYPKSFSVIKDLVTGQQIDFFKCEYNCLLENSIYPVVSIGPFSEPRLRHDTFSGLRWVAEFYTTKCFLYED